MMLRWLTAQKRHVQVKNQEFDLHFTPKSPRKAPKEGDILIPVEDLLPIAHPLAQKKLAKKLHKTVKKGL